MNQTNDDIEVDLARQLHEALASGRPISPVRARLNDDVPAAYRVQSHLIAARVSARNPRVGRKVGLTSAVVQTQLGVDQPDFGVLLEGMRVPDGGLLDSSRLISARVEAEVAFVLGRDLDEVTPEAVITAVDYATAALEIVDSRIANWDISIVDTVADNASASGFVLGERRLALDDFRPSDVHMELELNGEPRSNGDGKDCLGDPLNALLWVAETAARIGEPLRAGEIVLSGALGPMVPIRVGDRVAATVGPLGGVSVAVGRGFSA